MNEEYKDNIENQPEFDLRSPKLPEMRVSYILMTFLLLCFLSTGVFMGFTMLLGKIYGLDPMEMSSNIGENITATERSFVRWMLLFSHLGTFVLPGFLTVWLFYKEKYRFNNRIYSAKQNWKEYLLINKTPSFLQITLGLILLAVALPLVYYLYTINKLLPLPEWMHTMEGQTNDAIKGILKMENIGELLANLIIMALIPAIGEELVFRGILQQQLMRRVEPIAAILFVGAIFSAIHMQFEGFFSRWLLGSLLGWLYWETRNFWVPVAAHFFNNGFQVLAQYFYAKDMSTIDLEKDADIPWYVALGSVFLVYAVMRFIRQTKVDGN
jgi:uncharacterized protein